MTLAWRLDPRLERGVTWRDRASTCGRYRIEQGHDEHARKKEARSYTVLVKDPARRGGWRILGDAVRTHAEARTVAERHAAER